MSSDLHPVYDSEAYKSLAKVYGTGGLDMSVQGGDIMSDELTVFIDGKPAIQDGDPGFARELFLAAVSAGRRATLSDGRGERLASCPAPADDDLEERISKVESRLDSIVVDGEGRLFARADQGFEEPDPYFVSNIQPG